MRRIAMRNRLLGDLNLEARPVRIPAELWGHVHQCTGMRLWRGPTSGGGAFGQWT
jgi:hypothetical protein